MKFSWWEELWYSLERADLKDVEEKTFISRSVLYTLLGQRRGANRKIVKLDRLVRLLDYFGIQETPNALENDGK